MYNAENEYEYDTSCSQVDDVLSREGPCFFRNELVRHDQFGLGRVLKFTNLGPNSLITVKFNSGKISTLMLKYANLTKVSD